MNDALLVLNSGSSSIKFAVFDTVVTENRHKRLWSGSVTGIGGQARLTISEIKTEQDSGQATNIKTTGHLAVANDHTQALRTILDWLATKSSMVRFVAVGHRVVHGGSTYSQPVRIDSAVLDQLRSLIPLAPLHQPHALQAIEALLDERPQLPQVACFDTAFHITMPDWERRFAIPDSLEHRGIRRYGFHGLSYQYIASVMPNYLGDIAQDRVVIAHLGHGVSMCATKSGRSIATTMSFTPLDGLPMGTRSGSIDPAVVLYLIQCGSSAEDIADLLHHQSGLLGLSGVSGDMRDLLGSTDSKAAEAVDYFCYRVRRELGSLVAALGGLDAVIFTGGIGENAASVRAGICQNTDWLGLDLNAEANQANELRISTKHSKVSVWVIPTDEEQVIARSTAATLFE